MTAGSIRIGTTNNGALAGVFIGSGTTMKIAANVAISVNTATGEITRASSSLRYKTDVAVYTRGLAEVCQIVPKNFRYNNTLLTDAGFIAEEIAALGHHDIVLYDADGAPEALRWQNFLPMLVNAVKELKAENDELRSLLQSPA